MKTTITKLEFPGVIESKIKKLVSSKINVEFIAGKKIKLNNTNLGLTEPHKIIFNNSTTCLIVLLYDNDDNCYLYDLSNPVSFTNMGKEDFKNMNDTKIVAGIYVRVSTTD